MLGLYDSEIQTWSFPINFAANWNAITALMINDDDRLELFAIHQQDGPDKGKVQHCWQLATGDRTKWSGWTTLGDAVVDRLVVGAEADGSPVLIGSTWGGNVVMTRRQDLAWGLWVPQTMQTTSIALASNYDGRLEALGIRGGELVHSWENAPLVE